MKLKKKKKNKVYIGVGGNIGDSVFAVKQAFSEICCRLDNCRMSSLYKTSPQIDIDQNDFTNAVIYGETELTAEELLEFLQAIENKMGRIRLSDRPKGPRIIDLDILLYGIESIFSEKVTIPHPRIEERAFVLVPLLELAPELIHPLSGKSFSDFLPDVENQGIFCYKNDGKR